MVKRRACDWFDREGSLRIERGEDPHPHLDECPACRQAHDEYLGLVELLPLARGGDADLARRIRLAIASVLGALLCFFTRGKALAAGSAPAPPTTGVFVRWVLTGLLIGGCCGFALQDLEVPHPAKAAPIVRSPQPVSTGATPPPLEPAEDEDTADSAPIVGASPHRASAARRPAASEPPRPEPTECGPDCVMPMIVRGLCGGPCPASLTRD